MKIRSRFAFRVAVRAGAAALVLAAASAGTFAGSTAVWKAFDNAILRIDDQPPKEWNVYREGKKTENVLLQVGQRYFFIQLRAQKVFELNAATIKQNRDDLIVPNERPDAKELAISDWNVKDVGPVLRVTYKLTMEGRVVLLELPQWLNRGVTY
ncbi:MAG TPA: hypothetical protein VFO34_05615 [Candidatus Acidoferrales bacterium]|nr:hypothetical protein [Candidatus Acidoferrales bacterium]